MKRKIRAVGAFLIAIALSSAVFPGQVKADEASVEMYRFYNAASGEHFFTGNASEGNNLIEAGWKYEGVGWIAPSTGEPVYRLYNPNSGDHYYTVNAAEKDHLASVGWTFESIAWYSGGSVPLYCQYNPNAKTGNHNYTTSSAEDSSLAASGWTSQGVSWYGTGVGYGTAGNSAISSTAASLQAAFDSAEQRRQSAASQPSSSASSSPGSHSGVDVPSASTVTSGGVWVPTDGGTKYHSNSTCSGMKNPVRITLQDAINRGYTACGRCY